MTGRKTRALQVPPVVPYKALEKFSKALYGTTGGTYSARIFRPVMLVEFVYLGASYTKKSPNDLFSLTFSISAKYSR